MEMRAGATENARKLYERYIECHPTIRGYIKFAKWEERQGNLGNARRVYERALEELHDDEKVCEVNGRARCSPTLSIHARLKLVLISLSC